MPRTEVQTRILYQFDELDERAKERARDSGRTNHMILTTSRHYKTRARFLRAFHVHRHLFVACVSDATGWTLILRREVQP